MVIAERHQDQPNRHITLDRQSSGKSVLWIHYPGRPDKDTGFPIPEHQLDETISRYKLERLLTPA